MEQLTFISYDASLAARFKDLNTSWLTRFFYVEPIDEVFLSDPEKNILDKGGYIFFAKWGTEVVGTFALMKTGDKIFELGKMAVDEAFRGRKIGGKMLAFCLQKAKELGIDTLTLHSNTVLENAIHLYKKHGFEEVPLGNPGHKRSNIKMEINLAGLPGETINGGADL